MIVNNRRRFRSIREAPYGTGKQSTLRVYLYAQKIAHES